AGIGFLVARETGRRPRPALRGGRRRARPPRAAPRRSYDPAEILHLGWGATAFHIGGRIRDPLRQPIEGRAGDESSHTPISRRGPPRPSLRAATRWRGVPPRDIVNEPFRVAVVDR